MNLLLHMCCGPCSAFPLKRLRELGYEPTGYFFNPNIHPFKEFTRRLETAKEFAQKSNLNIIADDMYALEDFLRRALDAPNGRCAMCYALRMKQAARYAREHGFDAFTTSLLVSPYQKHDAIRQAAEFAAAEEGIEFIYEDFRVGWKEGVAISRELELYRQPYCGCIFSEKERYQKPKRSNSAAGQ